jgi:hypothetical protein
MQVNQRVEADVKWEPGSIQRLPEGLISNRLGRTGVRAPGVIRRT